MTSVKHTLPTTPIHLTTGTGTHDPYLFRRYAGYLDWDEDMIASLNGTEDKEHLLGANCVTVYDGVSMIQKKKSYSDVLKIGTSSKLENKTYQNDSVTGRVTLDWWKVYLDSCVMYHISFVEVMLTDVCQVKTALRGSCNTGVTTSTTKGLLLGKFDM